MAFPSLRPTQRDREYKKVTQQLRDRVVLEYIINDKSHRWLDEHVLKLDPNYSRGYMSMGLLHFIGLWDEHKGLYGSKSAEEVIDILLKQNQKEFKPIVDSLVRQQNQLYSDDSFDLFTINESVPPLFKKLGKSQYSDGVRIDKEYHRYFNPLDSKYHVKRGTARKIKILFNNSIYDAEYRYEDQTNKSIELQSIRFRKELKQAFMKVFAEPIGSFNIYVGADLKHFVFEIVPQNFYEDNDEEYPEGAIAFRLHKVRERNPAVIKKAKQIFFKNYKRLFCEVCGFDFQKVYGNRGSDFIEGHHKRLISEMTEGEKTKVEDIALVCSNCHRMLHRSPALKIDELQVIIDRKRGS
ncbi:HNH endonuclease [Paenibacillus sp. 8b26]|uniref:HNH endonuclease n=1 Tax=Paenibacillus sp. 8b26 TaxID=3424133 RepID=UPI003D648987